MLSPTSLATQILLILSNQSVSVLLLWVPFNRMYRFHVIYDYSVLLCAIVYTDLNDLITAFFSSLISHHSSPCSPHSKLEGWNVNSMCQPDWATGSPDIWSNIIILSMSVRVFVDEINIWLSCVSNCCWLHILGLLDLQIIWANFLLCVCVCVCVHLPICCFSGEL